ncbi:MAG: hypothetical protein IJS32_05840 [Kiritimatiellae bacterium]|nr:hypothetical protein [Kiritimatiellia bacterium]
MLEEWLAEVVKRHGGNRRRRRKDPLEARVDEVCKVLSLGEVERDLLVYALVRQMTDFDDFPWSGRRSADRGLARKPTENLCNPSFSPCEGQAPRMLSKSGRKTPSPAVPPW